MPWKGGETEKGEVETKISKRGGGELVMQLCFEQTFFKYKFKISTKKIISGNLPIIPFPITSMEDQNLITTLIECNTTDLSNGTT